MLPFRFQIASVALIRAVQWRRPRTGFSVPSSGQPDLDYAAFQALVTEARKELSVLTPEAVNALVGDDNLQVRRTRTPVYRRGLPDVVLAAELSFHATTAYDLLRHKGRRLENAIL